VLEKFLQALALMLVLEGVMMFAAPAQWREAVLQLAALENHTLRKGAAFVMLAGLALLWLFGH
jgi:uncharacterized protein